MPAVYAHDRFGREVYEKLTGDLKETVSAHYAPFQIGLQGPDIFFFYGYHIPGKVVHFGQHLHHVSAMPFFRHAVKVVRQKGRDSAEYAYLLGFICHFVLDSECHPYVEEMIGKTGVKHMEIEEEFEKLLLRLDGRDPFSYPTCDLIPTDWETAEAIRPFYPILDERSGRRNYFRVSVIQKALIHMHRIKAFFTVTNPLKRAVINMTMKLLGIYPALCGVMHQKKDRPECKESNLGLLSRYQGAVDLAVDLMKAFDTSEQTGRALPERFNRTFC